MFPPSQALPFGSARPFRSRARWLRHCAPLLAFLSEPRSGPELRRWATDRSMSLSRLEGMLGWLRSDGLLGPPEREDLWTLI
jgi:hypothetical protein